MGDINRLMYVLYYGKGFYQIILFLRLQIICKLEYFGEPSTFSFFFIYISLVSNP